MKKIVLLFFLFSTSISLSQTDVYGTISSDTTADVELEAATTYYWRVKTSDGTNASYSIVYSFKTQ